MLLPMLYSLIKSMGVYRISCLSLLIGLGSFSSQVSGQVLKPFVPKTSKNSPNRTIYNINGDFTMLGNTNLTLENYSLDLQNNMPMVFVDIDDDPDTFNSSSATLEFSTENGADPTCSSILFAGLYWTGRSASGPSVDLEKNGIKKTLHKEEIKIKGPGQTEYLQLRASPDEIWWPKSNDELLGGAANREQFGMFVGFVEITDYVKSSGPGSYTVADIALSEGTGGSLGYFGGWAMVVVYENHLMEQRDVVVFDGYALVTSGYSGEFLELDGFSAVESGDVNIKMGIIAGEGDRGAYGDYFEIEKGVLSGDFLRLSHSKNQPDNFFNASINTGGNARNPSLVNNTGFDIAMFSVPNPDNSVIGNRQTFTRFRYGSTIDTYIVFNITIAIDAYGPQLQGFHHVVSEHVLSEDQETFLISPGEEMEFSVEIRNKGNEGIKDGKLVIPIPLTAEFMEANMEAFISPNNVKQPYYDDALGAGGSLVWEIGDLPIGQDPDFILAKLQYRLKAAETCAAFSGFSCDTSISITGELSGLNMQTDAPFSGIKIIQGNFSECDGNPNVDPYVFTLDPEALANEDCIDEDNAKVFSFCDQANPFLPVEEIASSFPPETRFFNEFPIKVTSVEYTNSNPIPVQDGITEYFAVLRGENDCYQRFSINSEPVSITATVTSDYSSAAISCYGAADAAVEVSISGGRPPYSIQWDDENQSTTEQLQNIPPGTYSVVVTDSQGCQVSTEVTVEQPDPVTMIPNSANSTLVVSCDGLADGVFAIDVAGGISPLTGELFLKDDAGTLTMVSSQNFQSNGTVSFGQLSPGEYVAEVKDANGCMEEVSFSIDSPEPYYLTANMSNMEDCQVANSGRIEVIPMGGQAPFTFNWEHGPSQPILENLSPGSYTVAVIDSKGCTISETYILEEQEPLTFSVTYTEEVTCGTRGLTTTFFVDVSGGFPPYELAWSGGNVEQNGLVMTTSDPGEYTVTVVDREGCTAASSKVVEPSPLDVDFDYVSASYSEFASNLVNYTIQFTPVTVGDIIAYEWSFGDGESSQEQRPSHTFTQEGIYPVSLTVTDIHGCQLSQVNDINIEEAFIRMPNGFTPNGNGMNDYFFPRFNYITEVELWVFNKWGEAIYHSTDRSGPGWDGTYRGELSPAGNYVYKLRYTTPDGRVKEETNVFVLIR